MAADRGNGVAYVTLRVNSVQFYPTSSNFYHNQGTQQYIFSFLYLLRQKYWQSSDCSPFYFVIGQAENYSQICDSSGSFSRKHKN